MRLYPPAWAMGRCALEDFSLGDYRLPAGTTVLISQFITHRDARYFPDAPNFDPERFLAKGKATFPKSIYFPFGAGARQCVGESFAWTESALVLTTLAQQWQLRMDPTQRIDVQPLITLRSKHGMMMRAEPRIQFF
jgi:cytochrome P450